MSNIDFQVQEASLSQFAELQEALLSSGPREAVVSATAILNASQLRQARDSILFVDCDAATELRLALSDNNAAAADLQGILGLDNLDDACLLTFACASAAFDNDVDLVNFEGSATSANVQVFLRGADASGNTALFDSTTGSSADVPVGAIAMVEVRAINVTVGSEQIRFDVLVPGLAPTAG